MRILFLTQWFQPEPFFKGLPFAKELILRGHDVEILTGFPNYPGGEVYSGYRIRFFQREIMEGIRVNRVPLYPSHNNSGIQRILNYLSFCLCTAILGPFVIKRPDVIYVYNLPSLGIVAKLFKVIFRSKIVLDIQDLWPESVTQSKMLTNKRALSLLGMVTNLIYSSANHITVLSPGFKSELISRGIPEKNISVIYNWCNEIEISASETTSDLLTKYCSDRKFNVVFAGTMGKMQALDAVIKAASIIEKQVNDIMFWFIGGGIEVENLKKNVALNNVCNINFMPRVSEKEIGAILQKADLLLVHLKKEKIFEITIPSKIQAYLYIGRPILAAIKGDAAHLVETAKAGISCEPENPKEIAEAVLKIYAMSKHDQALLGKNGFNYYQHYLSIEVGTNSYEKIFSMLE